MRFRLSSMVCRTHRSILCLALVLAFGCVYLEDVAEVVHKLYAGAQSPHSQSGESLFSQSLLTNHGGSPENALDPTASTSTVLTTATLTAAESSNTPPDEYSDHTLFAVIGDYGLDTKDVRAVSELVKSWNPEFIATVGDNNYPDGSMGPLDDNVGQFYHQFIHNYQGDYGVGADEPKFFTTLGNHDWESIFCTESVCDGPYFEYFNVALDKRYYSFRKGPVRFFMMDSDSKEPDGISGISTQALWLKEQLAASEAVWNLVLMHHPPYSSGGHRNHEQLQWPFKAWGADAVISGHNHVYERIERDDMLFFVNGLGGKSRHQFRKEQPEWVKARQNEMDGAMRIDATNESITFEFFDRFHKLHDRFTLHASVEPDNSLHSASTRRRLVVPVAHASSDAMQNLNAGTVEPIGYVLELGQQRDNQPTMIGLRFTDVQLPSNANVTEAYIEFANQRDENSDISLIIEGEQGCNAKPFTAQPNSLTQRPKTTATVGWQNLDDWELVGESHKTSDISSIVQEVIGHTGWQSGNAMAFYIHGAGQRYGVSHELQPDLAPKLHVMYEIATEGIDGGLAEESGSQEATDDSISDPDDEQQWTNSIFIPTLINHTCPSN